MNKIFFHKILMSVILTMITLMHLNGQEQSGDDDEGTPSYEYLVGTGIGDFTCLLDGCLPHGVGTYGLVNYTRPIDTTIHDAERGIVSGVHLPLKARAITIKHAITQKRFVYVLLDLAFPSENIRRGVVKKLQAIEPGFESASLMLTATHTHSAPGGTSDYMGYEVATPGYRPDIVETIVESTYNAIIDAIKSEKPMQLVFSERVVPDSIPIAFSRRALPAYNSNPEIKEKIDVNENYKATDRVWQMIHFERAGNLHSMLNFFGAHPQPPGI